MYARNNAVPLFGLNFITVFFAYAWLTVDPDHASGDPVTVFGPAGAMLMYAAIIFTFATMFVAGRRAYRARRWLWFFLVITMWPVGYVYTLVINREG